MTPQAPAWTSGEVYADSITRTRGQHSGSPDVHNMLWVSVSELGKLVQIRGLFLVVNPRKQLEDSPSSLEDFDLDPERGDPSMDPLSGTPFHGTPSVGPSPWDPLPWDPLRQEAGVELPAAGDGDALPAAGELAQQAEGDPSMGPPPMGPPPWT